MHSLTDCAEAIVTCEEVANILKYGVFQLTKFVPNDCEILKTFPQSKITASCSVINLDLDNIVLERALGALWEPQIDILRSKLFPLTKKGILSFLSSTFDSLIILTPSILETRLVLQKLNGN